MSCKITVVARVREGGAWLGRLIESIDAQDLRYDEFGVLFLVPDLSSDAGKRLTELSGRRPNVQIAPLTADPASLARLVTGEWVLDLGTHLEASKPLLFPQALSRLVAMGAAGDCQAVLGRAVTAAGNITEDLFATDRSRLEDAAAILTAPGRVLALRRDLALARGLADPQEAGDWLAGARKTGVLGTYPSILISPPAQSPAASAAIEVRECTAEWRDGRIAVNVTAASEDAAAGEVLFGVSQRGSGLEYWLPGGTTRHAGGELSATAEIDVRTAALGSPLADGIWTISVGAVGGPTGRHVRSPLPLTPLAPGIVDGVLVVPAQAGTAFAVDVGASRSGPVPPLSPADVAIQENARGTLLTVRLDRLAVHGEARVAGALHLGKFPLPAYLIAAGGRARIECFLSGLAGTSPLSAQFGGGKPVPAGLNLEISPVGIMTVAAAGAGNAAAAAQPQTDPGEVSAITKLRRSVPAPLEPTVKSLARNKIAARVYRALSSGRPGQR